jgi:hypothetical protein
MAHASSGWGTGVDASNQPVQVQGYYANSPVGPVTALTSGQVTLNGVTQLPNRVSSGAALRKFVDTLPGIYVPGVTPTVRVRQNGQWVNVPSTQNNLGQYIPVAVAQKWVDLNGNVTNDDYIEIAAIEYTEKMHSDLPKATRLRGYVQLSTAQNPGKHIALTYLNGTQILDNQGLPVFAYDQPHHLGPIISAQAGTAVRVKFSNYLPVGGELFVPVDKTITGAGMGPDGLTPYSENRAVMHLVSGGLPWISAGNPHQWVAPAGQVNPTADGSGSAVDARGVSTQNVPDMADPGPGSTTLYFPNDMSARFMFYHDRTSGLTRLNSYAGMEAGYMVTDPTEQALVAARIIPVDQIPLIIEDKTFVPENVVQQDAKWDTTHWGQTGDLWFPHVYEPNQDPNSAAGTNAVGRWDYGPLFWPLFPATNGEPPTGEYGNATHVPDAYLDTPVINGTAYPTLTVDPKAYRFRILNASTDRYLNLGLYRADTTAPAPQLDANGNAIFNAAGIQQFFTGTEVKLVPALAADAAGNPPTPANSGTGGVAYDPKCLCQYPGLLQNVNAAASGPVRAWPTDARRGGVPDPLSVGPDFIAIGNDGGLLPNPVDIPSQPITYEANRRSITVSNAYGYGLLLGPAERSDAIVDFSKYAGQTLIVYNDAPAPFPFSDERNDYYSGNPDLSSTGGNYNTKPGYGPNTRTIMQIKVNAATVADTGKFNAVALNDALPAAYKAAGQAAPIVPQVIYNKAFGTNDADVYAHISAGAAAQPNLEFSTVANNVVTLTGLKLIVDGGTIDAAGNVIPNTGSGTGYDPANPPKVVFNNIVNTFDCNPTKNSAAATAEVDPVTRQVSKITGFYAGSGYVCAPTVSFVSDLGIGAHVAVLTDATNFHSIPVSAIAEQELFDDHGRYNVTGGVELPFTTAINQTTVPLNYIDAATESLKDGEVQIWKIVVNGLYTNSLSFNLADVQLVNRVGWDGTVKPPSSNEVGWKNTVRMNPLEDVVIAVRAKRAAVPFGQPNSTRPRDPSRAIGSNGSGLGFTNGQGVPALNSAVNVADSYDNEFVWNSAMLSNTENDFQRPIVFHPTVIKPDAPTGLTDPLGNGTLAWIDPTPWNSPTTLRNPQNEIGFKVLRAPVDVNANVGTFTEIAKVPANTTNWKDLAPVADTTYAVVAYNVAGTAQSTSYQPGVPVAPTTFTAVASDPFNNVTLNFSGGTSSNRLEVWRSGVWVATLAGTATSFVDTTVASATTYAYTITAVNSFGSKSTAPLQVVTPMIFVAAPTNLTATANTAGTSVTVRWTDAANNETAYWVEVSSNGGTSFAAPIVVARSAVQGTQTNGTVTLTPNFVTTPGSVYVFNVTAVRVTTSNNLSSPVTATVNLSAPAAPASPTGLTAVVRNTTSVTLTWVDNATNENSYLVTTLNNTTGQANSVTVNRSAALSAASGGTVTYQAPVVLGNSYTFTVTAQATAYGLTTTSGSISTSAVMIAPDAPNSVVAVPGSAAGTMTVTWADASTTMSGFTVQRSLLSTRRGVSSWGGWTSVGTVAAGVLSLTDTGLTSGATYRYQVRANSVLGNTAYVTSTNTLTGGVVAP